MTDGQNFFDQPVKNNLITYGNIRKGLICQGDDYTTGCLLDDNYFDNYHKMMAIDLRKQQELHTDPKAIQEINFNINLNQGENINGNTVMFFIIEEPKETILNFLHGTVNVLWMYSTILFCFNIISIWNDSTTLYNTNNTLNVKLSNYQLKKLKSEIKYGTEITSKVWSSIVHDSNDDSNQERNCIK